MLVELLAAPEEIRSTRDISPSNAHTLIRVAISLVSPLGAVASQSIEVARHAAGASEAVKVAGSNRRWDKGELSYSYVNESRGPGHSASSFTIASKFAMRGICSTTIEQRLFTPTVRPLPSALSVLVP